jgi:hypothetical protein
LEVFIAFAGEGAGDGADFVLFFDGDRSVGIV